MTSMQSSNESGLDGAPASASTLPASPYPGLRSFNEREWLIFFGRERFADRVIELLGQCSVLLVHGDSGAGKSSLIKAGVLPLLSQSSLVTGATWRTAVVRPQRAPLEELARCLAGQCRDRQADELDFLRVLSFGEASAPEVCTLLSVDERSPLCLVIDQFEELFESNRRDNGLQAKRVAQFLEGVANGRAPGLWVILTMRSEYLGQCAVVPGMAEIVGEHQYLLPRMTQADLLRAIQEPALLYGGSVSRHYANQLVEATRNDPDQLPLIQHALAFLFGQVRAAAGKAPAGWQIGEETARGRRPSTLLSQHADEVLQVAIRSCGLPDRHARRMGETILRALSGTNSEGLAIRRQQSFSELVRVANRSAESVQQFLKPFRATGNTLLLPEGTDPLQDSDVVDISHECLLRSWTLIAAPRKGLLAREFEDGLAWKLLVQQARRDTGTKARLLPAAYARERRQWMRGLNENWSGRYGGGWSEVGQLLEDSNRYADRRNMGLTALAFLMTMLVAIGVAYVLKHGELEAAQENEKKTRLALMDARQERNLMEEQRDQVQQAIETLRFELASNTDNPQAAAAAVQEASTTISTIADRTENLPARVYFHIADESQRESAQELKARFEETDLAGSAPVVPGIERTSKGSSSHQLRCFRKAECGSEAEQLLGELNKLLIEPKLSLQDLSARYENSTNIRPRHYEVWFASGQIRPTRTEPSQLITPPSHPPEVPPDRPAPSAERRLEQFVAGLRNTLSSADGRSRILLDPEQSARKFTNARTVYRVPDSATSIALLDATILGSASLGILFTDDALYYRTSVTASSAAKSGRIGYVEFAKREVAVKDWSEISLGNDQVFVTAGSPFSSKELAELLGKLQAYLRENPRPE